MQDCPVREAEGIERLISYAAGTLGAAESSVLERHLAECAKCRKLAGEQKNVWEALEGWTPAPISSDFDRRLYQRIAMEGGRPWWRFLWPPRFSFGFRHAAPVALACVALAAAFLIPGPIAQQPVPHSLAAPQQKVDLEQVERTLDDLEMLKQFATPPATERNGTQSQS